MVASRIKKIGWLLEESLDCLTLCKVRNIAQSGGAVEYTNCISADGYILSGSLHSLSYKTIQTYEWS